MSEPMTESGKETIGLFGGTFNPIHAGHLQAAREILDRFDLSRILFIPSNVPPHKELRDIASAEDRLEMVRLACASESRFIPSAVEVEAEETSYSILTLRKIRLLYPEAELFFLLGVDAFREIRTWKRHEQVVKKCRFIVMTRPGTDFAAAESILEGEWRNKTLRLAPGKRPAGQDLMRFRFFLTSIRALNISATEIRRRIRNGENIGGELPGSVVAYIRNQGLYRESEIA